MVMETFLFCTDGNSSRQLPSNLKMSVSDIYYFVFSHVINLVCSTLKREGIISGITNGATQNFSLISVRLYC